MSVEDETAEVPPVVAAKTDGVAEWMGQVFALGIFLGLPYYFFVWKFLPSGLWLRWSITGAVIVAVLMVVIFSKRKESRFFESVGNLIIVGLVILAAVTAAFVFAADDRTSVFKCFAVVYFAFLPAWLYLQFLATRGRTIWEEYVVNLFRLRIDDDAHLPAPPRQSIFYRRWAAARKDAATADDSENIYQKKFEALYGSISNLSIFRAENMAPVALATLLIAVGWIIVVQPGSMGVHNVLPLANGAAGPTLPIAELRFGFLGAYFYILQMLVRRYFQNDLRTHAYVNATMRVVVVLVTVWVLAEAMPAQTLTRYRVALSFVVGVFPQVGWQVIVEWVKIPFKASVKSLESSYPLSDLDGLSTWYESRLLEEGIEDMQNLATCNMVDAMLNTRIPIERLVDWVDQSLLNLHLPPDTSIRTTLREYGIRSATDLEDAFTAEGDEAAKLSRLLTTSEKEPSKLLTIKRTLRNEPNLFHVRSWKGFMEGDEEHSAVVGATAAPQPPAGGVAIGGDRLTP